MKENIAIEARKSSVLDHLASHVIQLQAGQQILMDAMVGMQQTMHMLLQNSSIARPGIYNHPVRSHLIMADPRNNGRLVTVTKSTAVVDVQTSVRSSQDSPLVVPRRNRQ